MFNEKFPCNLKSLFIYEEIASQFLYTKLEEEHDKYSLLDPIGDKTHSPIKGLIHRYPDRVLITPTYKCFAHCRFCFRKNILVNNNLTYNDFFNILNYIKTKSFISEVIISGGDPFILQLKTLFFLLDNLNRISTIKRIRIHTRALTLNPTLFTKETVNNLSKYSNLRIVGHINHSKEITINTITAIKTLQKYGINLFTQSVLLKNINDNENTLLNLLSDIINLSMQPYYLHYPDLVEGIRHFRISLLKAIDLIENLRSKISGYAIPSLIVDIPTGLGKISLPSKNAKFLNIQQNNDIFTEQWEFTSPLNQKKILINYEYNGPI